MVRARIIGTGSYTPRKILSNNDLARLVDTSDEWIMTRTGIKERHVAGDGEATSTFAYQAALKALEMAGITAGDLDMIIVATVTPDMLTPSVACLLQHKLEAYQAAAFDISAGCTGFLYALSTADSFIRAGNCSKVLVVGAESLSKITDYTDRTTCILFGDGAGAVVLSREQGQQGILSTLLYADGSCSDLLYMPGGGSAHPASPETIAKRYHYLKMDGNKVFKRAVKALEDCVTQILEKNKITGDQIALLISHQANLRIIQAIAKRLELPKEKVFVNIQKYGNTSSASVPIALDEANRQNRIKKNDLLLMNAFGAGFTWGSALVRW
ncbi:MAG: ketoacyl-ACP synthase III [Proteobacteria bacterium]|nr:ketoacyl-ACP synthase III [Pseudomonadota bacterium]